MAARIKTPLGTEVGLDLRDIVFDVGPATPRKNGTPTPIQFLANVRRGQTAGWTKMPLRTEVSLSLGDCVRWGPIYPQKKGHTQPHPIFGPYLLWPNGWMDQDGIWQGGRPWSSPHCATWGHSSLPQNRGQSPLNFGP